VINSKHTGLTDDNRSNIVLHGLPCCITMKMGYKHMKTFGPISFGSPWRWWHTIL